MHDLKQEERAYLSCPGDSCPFVVGDSLDVEPFFGTFAGWMLREQVEVKGSAGKDTCVAVSWKKQRCLKEYGIGEAEGVMGNTRRLAKTGWVLMVN